MSFLTFGQYDNDETAAEYALTIGNGGNAQTETLKAFSEDEFLDIAPNLMVGSDRFRARSPSLRFDGPLSGVLEMPRGRSTFRRRPQSIKTSPTRLQRRGPL